MREIEFDTNGYWVDRTSDFIVKYSVHTITNGDDYDELEISSFLSLVKLQMRLFGCMWLVKFSWSDNYFTFNKHEIVFNQVYFRFQSLTTFLGEFYVFGRQRHAIGKFMAKVFWRYVVRKYLDVLVIIVKKTTMTKQLLFNLFFTYCDSLAMVLYVFGCNTAGGMWIWNRKSRMRRLKYCRDIWTHFSIWYVIFCTKCTSGSWLDYVPYFETDKEVLHELYIR